jgi:hypothetical protein
VGKPEGVRPLVRSSVKGKVILKCDVSRYVGRAWSQAASGQGQMSGCCESGNETLGSIKCGKFLD